MSDGPWLGAQFLVGAFLIGASLSVVLAKHIKALNGLLYYGKVHQSRDQSLKREPHSLLESAGSLAASLTVPKRWFTHFYMLSTTLCLVMLAKAWWTHSSPSIHLVLYTLHSARRLTECLYVLKQSPTARMNITHYLVGLLFYASQGIIVYTESDSHTTWHSRYFAITVFMASSALQYVSHSELASLKKYSLPKAHLFRIVSSPHYLAELGIYVSFWMLDPSNLLEVLTVVWVAINLGASAEETRKYYHSRFSGDPALPPYAMIPRVW